HDLEHHAAGFLSPLVSEIEVGWSAPFLASGIQLVDLPGLGVAYDIQQQRTQDLLSRAQACLVVVDRSGITEACAHALLPLLRHLQESPDANWGQLVVAVTQLDQIARDQRAAEPREQRAPWQSHFDQLGMAARSLVHGQLAQQLAGLGLRGGSQRSRRGRIAASVRVMPVAPLEHRRLHLRDPDEPSLCSDESGPGIRRLRQVIHSLGAAWIERLTQDLSKLAETNRRVQTIVGPALREMARLLANGTFTSW
ncbi:MAG: GTPase domain-containing protein, partial [Kofleriaceae bacterium]